MKISFCLPSCNYNIILTREELQQLIDTGHTGVIRPDRIPGLYYDERGRRQEGVYHDYQINKDEDAKKRIIQGPSAKENGAKPSQDTCRNDILNILLHADAVTCTVTGYEPMLYASKALYEIPSNHQVTIDYNKMAKALYDAGYRKGGSQ